MGQPVDDYGTAHDDQLSSGYGRCPFLNVYRTIPNNHDNNQPYNYGVLEADDRLKFIGIPEGVAISF